MSEEEKDFQQRLQEALDAQFRMLEKRLDAQEDLLANLLMAYTEVSSALETLIGEVMSPRSEEEREAFRKSLDKRHAETLQMIQEVSREVERSGTDDLSASVLGMVSKKQGDPPVG